MRKYHKIISALLITLLLAGIILTAHALTVRQENNAARKLAVSHLLSLYPDAEKTQHRVLHIGNQERLVLVNLQDHENSYFCAVLVSEGQTIAWYEARTLPEAETEIPLLFVSKRGECYHAKQNCSGMKNPMGISATASQLLDEALRPCTRCISAKSASET